MKPHIDSSVKKGIQQSVSEKTRQDLRGRPLKRLPTRVVEQDEEWPLCEESRQAHEA